MMFGSTEWFDALSWTCMVCGEERPDAQISVAKRPVPGLEDMFPSPDELADPQNLDKFAGRAYANVRYCNDREDCSRIAHEDGPWDPRGFQHQPREPKR